MQSIPVSFNHAKHEISLSKDSMHLVITVSRLAVLLSLKSPTQGLATICYFRIMLYQVFGQIIIKTVQLSFHQYLLRKLPDQFPVSLCLMPVHDVSLTINHRTPRRIKRLLHLDIVPMFHRLAFVKAKNLKCDLDTIKIILIMGKCKITIFKDPNERNPGLCFGQSRK